MTKILAHTFAATLLCFGLGMLLGVVLVESGHAQPTPELEIWAGAWAEADLAEPRLARLPGNSSPTAGRLAMATAGFEFKWPKMYGQGRTFIEHGIACRSFELSWSDWEGAQEPLVERMSEFAYSLTTTRVISERWVVIGMLQPVISGDFQDGVSSESFNLNGALMAMRNHRENLRIGYGVVYSLQFGYPFPIPLFLLNWTGEHSRVDLMLPVRIEAARSLRPNLEFGLRMRADGGQAALSKTRLDADDPQLRFVDVMAGPFLAWRPATRVNIDLSGGFATHRELKLHDGDDEVADWSPDPAPTIRLSLRLSL